MSTGTPTGHSDLGPFEILLYPILGLLLAGLIAGLVAAVSVQLLRPWTGAGLRPPQSGYAPWRRLRVPVGFSVIRAVCVSISGLFPVLGATARRAVPSSGYSSSVYCSA